MGLLGSIGKGIVKVAGSSLVKKVGGGLLKSIPGVGVLATVGGVAKDIYTAGRKLSGGRGQPALPPITNLTGAGGGTGNVAYGGNIQAAAQARGMRVVSDRGGGYRRMNPSNIRALRRAIRRIGSAEKIFRQVFRAKTGRAPQQVVPKFGRKK